MGRLLDRPIGRGRTVGRSIGRQVGQLTSVAVGQLICRSFGRLGGLSRAISRYIFRRFDGWLAARGREVFGGGRRGEGGVWWSPIGGGPAAVGRLLVGFRLQ